jgi:hypothetical protein
MRVAADSHSRIVSNRACIDRVANMSDRISSSMNLPYRASLLVTSFLIFSLRVIIRSSVEGLVSVCSAVTLAVSTAVGARLRFVVNQTFAGVVVGSIHYDQARLIFSGASLASGGDRVKIPRLEMDQNTINAVRDRFWSLAVDHRDHIPD